MYVYIRLVIVFSFFVPLEGHLILGDGAISHN